MRKIDRERNGINFPSLYYPELYLLVGGYKAFFEKYPVSWFEIPPSKGIIYHRTANLLGKSLQCIQMNIAGKVE